MIPHLRQIHGFLCERQRLLRSLKRKMGEEGGGRGKQKERGKERERERGGIGEDRGRERRVKG